MCKLKSYEAMHKTERPVIIAENAKTTFKNNRMNF